MKKQIEAVQKTAPDLGQSGTLFFESLQKARPRFRMTSIRDIQSFATHVRNAQSGHFPAGCQIGMSGPPAIWLGADPAGSARIVRSASFCRRQGLRFQSPRNPKEQQAATLGLSMSAPPRRQLPASLILRAGVPADQIALDPANVRGRPEFSCQCAS